MLVSETSKRDFGGNLLTRRVSGERDDWWCHVPWLHLVCGSGEVTVRDVAVPCGFA